MDRSPSPDRPQRVSLLSLALITAALYFGREVLIPLALALLISFILTPLVQGLQQFRLGRVPAVLIVVLLVFGGMATVAWTMGRQVVDLAETLPKYEQNIRAKAASLRGGGSSVLNAAKKNVEHLKEELGVGGSSAPAAPPPRLAGKPQTTAGAPVAVTVVEPPLSPIAVLRVAVSPLLGPLGTAGLVLIFVIFMLIRREDMRDRLLRLSGEGRLNVTTQALDEAAHRVSRYLLMQSLVNSGTAVAVGVGLLLIGVPNALLWGLLAGILRFIPYVGPWVAASLPVLISLAVFPGWLQPALALGLFLLIELISNNVVEPLLYGAETGISTIGILVAAVFWTWLWGPVGLLLATPLTVCLVVLGRYVPQFRFLSVLLGDEPPLPLEAQVYHRLLAMDPAEAGAVLEASLKDKTVAEHYDRVLIPALILAERDRHRGELTTEREDFVDTTLRDWIEELAGRTAEDGSLGPETAGDATAGRLVCVPANDRADELAGQMFAQLAARGSGATVLPHELPRSEMLRRLAELGAEQVFISALAPFAYTQAREVCRDLRTHFPGLRIVVALWDLRAEAERYRRRLVAAGADEVVATLVDAVKAVRQSPSRAADPAALAAELGAALCDADTTRAEKLLADAEQQLPVETLAAEVLLPALAGLKPGGKAGRLTAEQEIVAGDLLRARLVALGEASPQSHGYRALIASDPEEESEAGLLIFTLLLRRAGWNVVHLGQREDDYGLDEVIAAVQPHALVLSATHPSTAAPLLSLAETLHERHPGLLLAFHGPGFQPAATAAVSPEALHLPADPRQAVAAIEARRSVLQPLAEQAA
ncbi:MAG TPA: AI-2E family transporter [Thermoanaerobaculia bacterium]|nr:AI-2E family transporter [Thermoanaerobaculia bacterium]